MISYLLIAGIAYGIAYWISSAGMAIWRAVVSFLIALVVGWLGGTLVSVFLISTFFANDIAATTFNLLGSGFWMATTGAGVGVYRARYKLRTGQDAPPLTIPKWISMSALALFVIGILAAVALPAYQDHAMPKASAVTQPKSVSSTDVAVDWDKGEITPPAKQPPAQAERGPWEQYQYQDGVAASKRGDYTNAAKIFHALAANGHSEAQSHLGGLYYGGQGVLQDYVESAKWYRMAAMQGNAVAQSQLGISYAMGRGVLQDYVEAVRLYRMAATQGDALAQSQLGISYLMGQGVPQDYVRAHMWFNLSATSGKATTMQSREIVAESMTPQQIAQAQQMARDCQQRKFQGCD